MMWTKPQPEQRGGECGRRRRSDQTIISPRPTGKRDPMVLPPLPDDALELVWEYVRRDLRPRMKRNGPLLNSVRLRARCVFMNRYATWIANAYKFWYEEHPANLIKHAAMVVLCIFHLDHLYVVDGKAVREQLLHDFMKRCLFLWSRVPLPDVHQCHPECPAILYMGPPTLG